MPKDDVIPKLVGVFRQYGYEGATLSRLSEATGLGRASLYHHFPQGKEGMATAVLDYLNQGLNDHILAPLQSDLPPEVRLQEMAERIDQFYVQGKQACLLALLSTGEAQDLFAKQVQTALRQWIEGLVAVAIEAGIAPEIARDQAEEVVLQIQGALVLTRGLNDSSIFQRVLKRLPELLLDHKAASLKRSS